MQCGDIETFCFLRYWNNFSSKFINILNYIKSLCCFKYFDPKNHAILCPKMFQYPQTKTFPSWQNILMPPYCILAAFFFVMQTLLWKYFKLWQLGKMLKTFDKTKVDFILLKRRYLPSLQTLTSLKKLRICLQISNELHSDDLCYR